MKSEVDENSPDRTTRRSHWVKIVNGDGLKFSEFIAENWPGNGHEKKLEINAHCVSLEIESKSSSCEPRRTSRQYFQTVI